MDILIRGMEMPTKGYRLILIHADGSVQSTDGETTAIPVPPHGRLGDLDELAKKIPVVSYEIYENIRTLLESAPTIIPAEEGE